MEVRKYYPRTLCCACLLALALGGCAAGAVRGTMHYHPGEASVPSRLFWPSQDVPRYAYLGTLTGEDNFGVGAPRTGLKKAFDFLVGLFEETREPEVLLRPQGGVVDEATGRIYVTDVERGAVFVFDEKAGELQMWRYPEGAGVLRSPIGIAMGADGQILVSDSVLGRVFRFSDAGKPLGAIGAGNLKRPTGIARDPAQKEIYVADTAEHDIKVFSDDGRLLRVIGGHGSGPGELNSPTFLAFADGRLYVADTMNSRVQIFQPDGNPIASVGARGIQLGDMVRPKGVAVDGEGNLYVIESYYDHLLVYDRDGRFLLPIGGSGAAPGKFYLPSAVWTDGHNRVFVADVFNARVQIFQFLGGDHS